MSADSWGVAEGYRGPNGDWVAASEQARLAVRKALGWSNDDFGPPNDGAVVRSEGEPIPMLRGATLLLENGSSLEIGFEQAVNQPSSPLPAGYHQVIAADGSTSTLIIGPKTCYPVGVQPTWGWAVQMYAMRSRKSWGIGDFGDLETLTRWSADRGAGMVLVNPLHATAPGIPQQPSPYFPTSRCFRNPLALSVPALAGASLLGPQLERFSERGAALNLDRRINRDAVFALKYEAFEQLWRVWNSRPDQKRQHRFSAYLAQEGNVLRDYATYCALSESHGGDWRIWPSSFQQSGGSAVAGFREQNADRIAFHSWLQFLVDEQLNEAAPGVDLMTDLAIGVDRAGADVWMWPDSFCLDMSVGAPPDAFNTNGQNWGLPPLNPWKLRKHNYEVFIRTVRSAFRHAGALRMDHVMGLFRLYWIPQGAPATDGCYVYQPFRDLLTIVAIESQRAGAYVVGEDLGTVEDYVREELAGREILSYRLQQFEPGPTSDFPKRALAAFTTHDLPTIAGLWTRFDVNAQVDMGLSPNVEGTEEIRNRLAHLSGVNPATDVDVHQIVLATYKALAQAPSAVITANLDDALGVVERPNMPGTIDEWPNWRIALPVPLEDALLDPRVQEVTEILNR